MQTKRHLDLQGDSGDYVSSPSSVRPRGEMKPTLGGYRAVGDLTPVTRSDQGVAVVAFVVDP